MRQGVRMEPVPAAISEFLDSQHGVIERVRRDLVRRLKHPHKGRRGMTPPQVLRSLVLMRVKNWNYRELRERIADGVTLRQFTDFYSDPVPKHNAINSGFNRLTPETLRTINDMIIRAAVALESSICRAGATLSTRQYGLLERSALPSVPPSRPCWQECRIFQG
jgi:transposase, IS5 family